MVVDGDGDVNDLDEARVVAEERAARVASALATLAAASAVVRVTGFAAA